MPDTAARRLLAWYRASARALPWRTPFPRDPYLVLVSEVMAQQTQVDRVAPAFERFVARFPSLEALAAAGAEDVLHAFSGLGYYRRARHLHEAARAIRDRGGWPTTATELARLPGFGPYTAAAVAAFAFGGDEPPADGNVARVAARLRALALPLGSAALLRHARAVARALHAEAASPQVWEALMELGAVVCTPASPRCGACPLAAGCAALAAGTPSAFPLPRLARARERERWSAVWLRRGDGRVLLRRVESGGLLVGLWLPPFTRLADERAPADAAAELARAAGHDVRLAPAGAVSHGITHRDIRVFTFVGDVGARAAEPAEGWSWQDPIAPSLPTSSLLGKIAEACARPDVSGPRPESER